MEIQLRDLIDLCNESLELLLVSSPGGVLHFVNRSWRETLGYTDRDLAALGLRDVLSPESRSVWEETTRRLQPGTELPVEMIFLDRDGRKVSLQGKARGQFIDSRLSSVRVVFQPPDTVDHPEKDLRRFFQLSLDLLCVAGVDGYFKYVNPSFQTTLGYSEEELLSSSFLEFVHPDDRAETVQQVERLARGLPVVDFQNRYLARDGTYRWLAWRSAPWVEKGLIYAVARDITEDKEIQQFLARQTEELARSNEDLEQFAWVASHDLRAPLRAIANLSEWIEEDIPDPTEPLKKNLERLRLQVQRMEKMTDDLLAYARAGLSSGEVTEVDSGKLVHEIVSFLSPPPGFQVTVDPQMPIFRAARQALEQVFRNLISNSIKHHDRPDGRIHIEGSGQGDHYEFRITDDGPGIPRDFQDQVFKMFQRMKPRDEVEGTGIGLPMVKRIVESHGGEIRLESEGRGAVFSFTWPAGLEGSGD